MNITQLEIENIKRISAVSITPDGTMQVITGDNGAGKSSVLDAILLALSNEGLEDPIRHGASTGVVRVKLKGDTEYQIERKVTSHGRTLKITSASGPVPAPQTFLNQLIGSIAFDPLEFVRMKPKDQAAALRKLLGIDSRPIEQKRQEHYDERTVVNREMETLKAQLSKIPELAADVPDVEVSASDLVRRRTEYASAAVELANTYRAKEASEAKIVELNGRIAKGRALLAQLEQELTQEQAHLLSVVSEVQKAAEASEVAAREITKIDSQIAAADTVNQSVRAKRERAALVQRIDDASEKAKLLTTLMQECDREKEKLLSTVTLPYPKMTFDEAGVFVDGIRFDQLSTGEQVRISTAIAMAGNPKLKVVLIREGALVNRAGMAEIAKLASERGYQVWAEVFRESPGQTGIHIVDGNISAVNGEVVK